jgi:hypothetical protein
MRKSKKHISSIAIATMLLATGAIGPVNADNTSVDVSNSRASIHQSRVKKSADNSAPVNENRDASDSPVVQPVASMKGQTCIATGGVEVPCETDNEWFYAPKSCYASKEAKGPYYRKHHTAFECRPVGNNVPSLTAASPSSSVVMVPTSEADALATATKSGAQMAEDALADYDFEKLVLKTQPSDASLRPDAFVFTQGYVWAWLPESKARSSSQKNPLVSEATDGDTHVQLKISFLAMNVHFDGQKTGVQGFIQCSAPGQAWGGEGRGGSNCSWKAKKQDTYKVTSSVLYKVEWVAGDESGVLIHEEPMDGVQAIRVQDGYAVNVK